MKRVLATGPKPSSPSRRYPRYHQSPDPAEGRLAIIRLHVETWTELVASHDQFVADYNYQVHRAHRDRLDGRQSPAEACSGACSNSAAAASTGCLRHGRYNAKDR